VVVPGMFDIYGTLLGVKFVEAPDLKVWHPSVKAYRIQRDGSTLAVFYLDLFPRPGKFSHAACFPVVPAYQLADGRYHAPSGAMVTNFNPGDATHPALLSHDEVQLLFHEFGHIMHDTLTTARYQRLSGGKGVRIDFLEAPSQMMENWVWNKEGLNRLSGYYLDHSRKLPMELVQRLLFVRNVGVALRYLRQLSYATIDMELHTSDGQVDPDTVYNDGMRDISLVPEPTGACGVASFEHMMNGYEAGYYGYPYSKVFAEDMFSTRFVGHLLDPVVGADYLHSILEPGGTLEPLELIEHFLHRAPDNRAFLRSIGVN
jgi:thimet oligopeptidase